MVPNASGNANRLLKVDATRGGDNIHPSPNSHHAQSSCVAHLTETSNFQRRL